MGLALQLFLYWVDKTRLRVRGGYTVYHTVKQTQSFHPMTCKSGTSVYKPSPPLTSIIHQQKKVTGKGQSMMGAQSNRQVNILLINLTVCLCVALSHLQTFLLP